MPVFFRGIFNDLRFIEVARVEIQEVGGACSKHGRDEKRFRKPEGKGPFGRHRRRCEDNIRRDVRVIGWEVVEWMRLTQDRDQ
jgi:hypothetical protein